MGVSNKVFGYSYMGCSFREILRFDGEGFTYNGRRYIPWSEVAAYRAFPHFMFDLVEAFLASAKRRMCFYLRNGDLISVRGDLLRLQNESATGGPMAFDELLREIRGHGITEWRGPREEIILFGTAWVLLVLGAAIGMIIGAVRAWSLAESAMVAGVLLSQLAFLLAPWIGHRTRRLYISAHADGSLDKAPPKT